MPLQADTQCCGLRLLDLPCASLYIQLVIESMVKQKTVSKTKEEVTKPKSGKRRRSKEQIESVFTLDLDVFCLVEEIFLFLLRANPNIHLAF